MADFQVRGELEKTNAVSKAMLLSQLPNSTPGKARKSCSGLPRRLAALPKQITDGSLTVAGTFVGKVGDQRAK
jgi:hypothetical protein